MDEQQQMLGGSVDLHLSSRAHLILCALLYFSSFLMNNEVGLCCCSKGPTYTPIQHVREVPGPRDAPPTAIINEYLAQPRPLKEIY